MQLKVPVKVQINMVDTTIKAIKRMKKVCPKNTSKDFKRGFNYCRDRLVKTLEYIKEKEWYTDKADVVEVVRCKECEHYSITENGLGLCGRIHFVAREMTPKKEDDFCSWGEKKE